MKALRQLAAGAIMLVTAVAAQASLVHDYELNNSLADSFGGSTLVSGGGSLNATGYSFAANQGLSLTGAFANSGNYSIEMKFNFASLDGWQKIVDFKNLTTDEGLYDYYKRLQFVVLSGSGFETAANEGFAVNEDVRLILTRDATTQQVVGYLNGIEQLTFSDTTNQAVFSQPGGIANFFIDDSATGGEASAGAVDYIRIYDAPLTAAQASCLATGAPADCLPKGIPEPGTLALIVFGLSAVRLTRYRSRKSESA